MLRERCWYPRNVEVHFHIVWTLSLAPIYSACMLLFIWSIINISQVTIVMATSMHHQTLTHTQNTRIHLCPTSTTTSLAHTHYICVICANIRRPMYHIARSRSRVRLAPVLVVQTTLADDARCILGKQVLGALSLYSPLSLAKAPSRRVV